MLAIRLDHGTEEGLGLLAKAKNRSKSDLVREAIHRLLEDEEDLAWVIQAKAETSSAKPLSQLRQEVGLGG